MIDEPEISLHIDWQFDFIDKLLEIQHELRETKPLMFLIATHSPQILSDHQDRAIEICKQLVNFYILLIILLILALTL